MRSISRRFRRARRGSNVVEFALTLPIFFGIVMALVDFGWLYATQAGIHNLAAMACREGAMIDPEFGSPQATATSWITANSHLFCQTGCTVTVTDRDSGVNAVPNRTLECQITKNFTPLVGLTAMPPALTTTSQYRLEWQRSP